MGPNQRVAALLSRLILALAALAVTPQALAETAPVPVMTGGWSPIAAADAAVAARFAVRHLPRGRDQRQPRLRRIESAEQQVVAGLNTRIILQLQGGSRWQVLVWRKLDGTMVLTARERL